MSRAFSILACLHESARPLTTEQIATDLHLNYKTVHRFMLTLEHLGAVTRIGRTQFSLGILLADLGQQVAIHRTLRIAAMPELQHLVRIFGESVQIAVRRNDQAISVAHVSGTVPNAHGILVGDMLPLHCTAVGKVLLAGMEHAKFLSLVKILRVEMRTLSTLVSRNALIEDIRKVEARGYAVNDRESALDVRAAAVPISDRSGRVIAALSLSGHPDRISMALLSEMVCQLKKSSDRISAAIYKKQLLLLK